MVFYYLYPFSFCTGITKYVCSDTFLQFCLSYNANCGWNSPDFILLCSTHGSYNNQTWAVKKNSNINIDLHVNLVTCVKRTTNAFSLIAHSSHNAPESVLGIPPTAILFLLLSTISFERVGFYEIITPA